jgi:hypothetical protein
MDTLLLCPGEFLKAQRSVSGGTDCVECARRDGLVFVRDDKVPFGSAADTILTFTEEQFDTFQACVRAGEDLGGLCLSITEREPGVFVFRSTVGGDGAELTFTEGEVLAFYDGIKNREFDVSGRHADHSGDCAHRAVERFAA